MRNWDNLRIFLSVARTGSLSAAARDLGVNHSTVFRRVAGFEQDLGVRLFERHRDGYALTAAGEEMLAETGEIEERVQLLDRRLSGRDLRLSGSLRIATTDTLMQALLPPQLAAFRAAYPRVELEVAVGQEFVSLGRREADVAVRAGQRPPESLVGRSAARLGFAVYGSPAYLSGRSDAPLEAQDWLGPDESLAHTAVAGWLRAQVPPARIRFRSNSLVVLYQAARAGLGLALLPCFLADPDPGLRRQTPPLPGVENELWLLTHADLRRTARVRAFLDFLHDALAGQRPLLEGRPSGT